MNLVKFEGKEREGYIVEAGFPPSLGFPIHILLDAPVGVRGEPQVTRHAGRGKGTMVLMSLSHSHAVPCCSPHHEQCTVISPTSYVVSSHHCPRFDLSCPRQEDPSDGYLYALTRVGGGGDAEELEVAFLMERQSVGLPGLAGVVSPPGTWEPRQTITIKPALWDNLKGPCM